MACPSAPLSPDDLSAQVDVSRETMGRLTLYVALLKKWNRRINLVAARSLEDVWRRHILDSLQLRDHLPPRPHNRPLVLVDIGSGAGLPGLVLAAATDAAVHLVESDGRKAIFLREAAREMGLSLSIHEKRIESTPGIRADVVTARALAPLPKLLHLASPFLRKNDAQVTRSCGLFLKGREVAKELFLAHKEWEMSVDSFPSLSDSQGSILRIQDLRPLDPNVKDQPLRKDKT